MGVFDHFPYTNLHELNLTWILEALREFETEMHDFVSMNSLKYADPIDWNITTQYEKNTIVIDPITGIAYLSVQPVPAGVSLNNTDYWTVVFDLSAFIINAAKNFTNKYESRFNTNATFSSDIGDWIVIGETLYVVTAPINIGDLYVINTNIEHITIKEIIDIINNNIGDINELHTSDKTSVVNAVNEIYDRMSDSLVVFMPITQDLTPNTYASGNCTVFITKTGKIIMIDSGAWHSWNEIHNELMKLNITHIDYFLLSHFHSDHYTNLPSLISDGYIDSDTIAYMPRTNSITPPGEEDEPTVRGYLSICTDQRVFSSDNPLEVDDMLFEFFNCDKSDYDYYNSINSTYNNYSVCAYVTYKNSKILIPADIMSDAMAYLVQNKKIKKCDVMMIPHHCGPNGLDQFYVAARASYAVAPVSTADLESRLNDYNQIKYANTVGSIVYCQSCAPVYVGLGDSVYSVLTDAPDWYSNYNATVTVYYGSNSTLGIGTSSDPFANLDDALGLITSFRPSGNVRLEATDAYTYNGNLTMNGGPYEMILAGKSASDRLTINGKVLMRNCHIVFVNADFVFSGEGIAFEAYKSNVTCQECNFSGEQKTGSAGNQRCVTANQSNIVLNTCDISDKGVATAVMPGSSLMAFNCTGSNNTALTGGALDIDCIFYNCTISHTQLLGYATNHFKCNYNDAEGFDNTGHDAIIYKDATGASPTKTISIDFSDSRWAGAQIYITDSAGDMFVVSRWGSSLSAAQQAIVGTLEGSQVCNITKAGMVLSIEYNLGIRVYSRL